MASNQVELVVTVEVDKANQSIKSVNANLSGMEAAATRSARAASSGIDGMTASMVKGATAGNLLADGIKKIIGWVKEMTVEVAKYAARTDVLAMVTQQLAKVNNVSAGQVDLLVDRIKALGITTQEAHGVVQRMIFAQLDLSKATQLARVAQNAAVIAGVDSSEALENIILGITTGQTRLLHNMGLQVSLLNVETQAANELGHALSDQEKREAMLNAVLKEGIKIEGTYEAAMEKVGKQMTSLTRYFNEAKKAVGEQFQPAMQKVVEGLKELALWIKDNAAFLAEFAKTVAALAAAGAIGLIAQKLWGLVAAMEGLGAAVVANPIGLIAAGVAAAGAIIYSQFSKIEQSYHALDETYHKWLNNQITGAKSGADLATATRNVEKAFDAGTISTKEYTQALDMLDDAKRRVFNWGNLSDYRSGLRIKIPNPQDEAAAAAALAEEVGKAQLANEKAFRDRALEASKAGLTGFAKDVADINAEIAKRTVLVDQKGDSHRFALTRAAWNSIIDEMQKKLQAFKDHFALENKKALADYLKDEEDAHRKAMEFEAQRFHLRLGNDTQIAQRNLEHVRDMYTFEEQRAGFERDKRLRDLEGTDAQTLKQKVWVEQQKAEIEIDYLEKVNEIKMRLFDMETSRMVLEEEANMERLGYRADEIKARIGELTQQREDIRQANQEATDAALDAARQNAANRSAEIVRDQNRRIFDSLNDQAGGVFDALLQKSQSVWSAIGNSLKTALLTAIKEVVTSRVAAMLMYMFTGQRVSFAGGGAGAGGGVLSGLGGLLGIGAAPVFGGSGGVFGSGPVNGNPMVLSAAGGGAGSGGMFSSAGLAGFMPGLRSLFGIGGSVATGPGMASTWEAATLGQKLSSIGHSTGFALAGGLLAFNGLQRGGIAGLAETTAGGAMIGYKFGGPLGAGIGAAAGLAAGLVRLFIKGATEKAREKIKATYGVDISDKVVLQQIVDTAKQAFGGNLDMAIRSQQVRDLIELYAMSTGQKPYGLPGTVRAVSLVESGGSLFQSPGYSNGTPLPGLGGRPALDRIGGGVATNAGVVVIQLDGPATTSLLHGEAVQAIASNPRIVQGAVMSASKSNAGRRELTSLQLSPGLVTA